MSPATKTTIHWDGATAEQMAEFLEGLAPTLTLAVIRDEGAVVYHRAPVAEVRAELDETSSIRPAEGFAVSGPSALEGSIPAPPDPTTELRTGIKLDPDKLAKHGLELVEIMRALNELGVRTDVEAVSQATFLATAIPRPDGTEVPLNEIASREEHEVSRPLLIDRR